MDTGTAILVGSLLWCAMCAPVVVLVSKLLLVKIQSQRRELRLAIQESDPTLSEVLGGIGLNNADEAPWSPDSYRPAWRYLGEEEGDSGTPLETPPEAWHGDRWRRG